MHGHTWSGTETREYEDDYEAERCRPCYGTGYDDYDEPCIYCGGEGYLL